MVIPFKQCLARWSYSSLWRLLSPFYVFKLWWRGRKEPVYRQHIGERFGLYGSTPAAAHAGSYVWVHAVSLGEARAAAVLIDELRRQIPDMKLLLTHGTATGRVQGKAILREGDIQCWLPIDTPGSVKRFFRHFRPQVGLLMETEMWPNVMHMAQKQQVPIYLVNARLSRRSLKGMKKVNTLLRPAYAALNAALAQSRSDARRLKEAGVATVEVLGNLKFDMQPDPTLLARGRQWKLAESRPIIMAASTREGEEADLLQAWQAMSWHALLPDQRPVLLLVPRHPQRFDAVARLVSDAGLTLSCRSAWSAARLDAAGQQAASVFEAVAVRNTGMEPEEAQIWLGDSLGEMPLYYGMADIVLLGGSFKDYGGQNLLEALACDSPVIMGEYTYNFTWASEMALQAGVACRVADFAQALSQVQHWLEQPQQLRTLQAQASGFIHAHQGAAQHMAEYIAGRLR